MQDSVEHHLSFGQVGFTLPNQVFDIVDPRNGSTDSVVKNKKDRHLACSFHLCYSADSL